MRSRWMFVMMALVVSVPALAANGAQEGNGTEVEAKRTTTARVDVDCDKGGKISRALQQPGDDVVIRIKGTCHEDVVLHRDNVTVLGAAPGATVVGSFTVDGKSQITFRDFTIREGDKCIWVLGNGSVKIINMQILNCQTRGILVHGGNAFIQDTTVDHAGNVGIFVRGGQMNLAGRVASTNCGFSGFGATLGGAISAGSQIFGPPADIVATGNTYGIIVQIGGSMEFPEGSLTSKSNKVDGFLLATHSLFMHGEIKIDIEDNGRWGVDIVNSTWSRYAGITASMLVKGNKAGGIRAWRDSFLDLDIDTKVLNNQGPGIFLESSLALLTGTTVTGNSKSDLVLIFGSHVSFDGNNNFGGIACDSTIITRGDLHCPSSALSIPAQSLRDEANAFRELDGAVPLN